MLVDRSSRRTGSLLRLAETAGPISLRGVRFGPPVSWRSAGCGDPPNCGTPPACGISPGCGIPPGCDIPLYSSGCGNPLPPDGNDSVIVLPFHEQSRTSWPRGIRSNPTGGALVRGAVSEAHECQLRRPGQV